MTPLRSIVRTLSLLLACCAAAATLRAAEPNNTPATATVLAPGQWIVHDSLDGDVGRPDTILGHYDPAYSTLSAFDDNSSPVGNGYASQLLGIPVRFNGSAYFRVTGSPDTDFAADHWQLGQYSVTFDVRDPLGTLVPEKSFTEVFMMSPLSTKNTWMDPSPSPDPLNPEWTGFTVDVTIDNVIGPGLGDSLDFFVFTGFEPFAPIKAFLTAEFNGLIGLFDAADSLIATSNPLDPMPMLEGFADSLGRVKIGVTGQGDAAFIGAHAEVGAYTLQVVPEPASVVLLACGAALCLIWRRVRRR